MSSNIRCPWTPSGARCCISGDSLDTISRCAYDAAKSGDEQAVEDYITAGFIDFDLILRGAAAGGQDNLVKRMIELGADDYVGAMREAAFEGQRNIVYYFMDLNAPDYVGVLEAAAKGQQTDFLSELLNWKPVPSYIMDKLAGFLAENSKNLDDLLWEEGVDLNIILYGASRGGNLDLVREIISRFNGLSAKVGFTKSIDLDGAMGSAAGGGHMDVVQFLYHNGARKIDWARAHAMSNGKQDVVDFLSQLGATEARPRDASRNPTEYAGNLSMYSLKGLDTSSVREFEPIES